MSSQTGESYKEGVGRETGFTKFPVCRGPNPGVMYDLRSNSSTSNQSTADTRPLNPKIKHHRKHNEMVGELSQIRENSFNSTRSGGKKYNNNNHHQQQPPNGYDYGSYEITV